MQLEELQTEAQSSQGKLAAARKETEVERERFKKIIQDLKKKIDRSAVHTYQKRLATIGTLVLALLSATACACLSPLHLAQHHSKQVHASECLPFFCP